MKKNTFGRSVAAAIIAANMALAGCGGKENELVPTPATATVEPTVVPSAPIRVEVVVKVEDAEEEQLTESRQERQSEESLSGQEESFWGPAGEAPQTRAEAAELLGVPETALTELNPEAGDPTVIGWVVGEAPYEKRFTPLLPAGVCVDYARSSSELTGETEWSVEYPDADWNRALMAGMGKIEANKATLYWTQCSKE